MATPRRQEQEAASAEITEVATGVLRLQLPIDMPGLGHVNCYACEDERGFALVDPGLPGEGPWESLLERLAEAGIPLARVHTVVVTHSHPDHFGGAGRLRATTGSDILTHSTFRTWWVPEPDVVVLPERDGDDQPPWTRPTPWGSGAFRPPPRSMGASDFTALWQEISDIRPTLEVEDADTVRLAKREWVAYYTPGHSPDHLCLLDPDTGVLLSGDHVLPSITPHISGVGPSDDPLAEFFASLDRMLTLEGVRHVLPAHGHPFTDLPGRVAAIKRHHEERLAQLTTASQELGRPASVEELSHQLFAPRAWGSMAESETYAHLEHLRLGGRAEVRHDHGLLLYTVV